MVSNVPASLHSDSTDLGTLWTNAVDDYMKKTGKGMDHLRARSMGDAIKMTESSMQAFGGFRHNDGKVDKVRSAFSRHLESIQKVINATEMVGAAAGAFPPAMPVGLVFAACGHLLSAFAGVKADYDRVEDFFEHSGRFFERLAILEGKADSGPLAVAIVRVFSAQLSICGLVEAMVKAKRFKQWLNALWNLEDQELAAAYAAMQESIEELGETVGYASYNAIKITQDSVERVNSKVDDLDNNIEQFRSTLNESVQALYARNLNLEIQISDGFVSMQAKQDKSHAMQVLLAQQQVEILRAVQNSARGDFDQAGPKHGLRANGKGDLGDSKVQALGRIKSFFEDQKELYPDFDEALATNRTLDEGFKQSIVTGTTQWATEDPNVHSWLDGTIPLLWIRGPDGVGKTYIAHSIIQKLHSRAPRHSIIAYFYLRAGGESLQYMQNAFACSAVQLAESNTRYLEHVAAKLKEDVGKSTNISTWTRFFTSVFTSGNPSMGRLHLVLDGLDEINEKEKELLLQFLRESKDGNANISVLVTGGPEATPMVELLNPVIVDVTKEKIRSDLKTFAISRMGTLPRLRKFRLAVKKVILRKVVTRADCMLYVDHMLKRLSDLGREDVVLNTLGDMPANLCDLYKLLLEECGRDRTHEQFTTLRTLFSWVAFSNQPITLSHAWEIVRLANSDSDDTLDLEGEIIGRSSRILELSQASNPDIYGLEDSNDDMMGDLSDEDESQSETSEHRASLLRSALTFQERSLCEYFRTAVTTSPGTKDLRMSAVDAHVHILSMCAYIIKNHNKQDKGRDRLQLSGRWFDQFIQVPVDDVSDDAACKVLVSIYYILANITKHPIVFRQVDLYSQKSLGMQPWYSKVVKFAQRCLSLPANLIPEEIINWATNIDAKSIALSLARGHFTRWVNEVEIWTIMQSWWEVQRAFKLYQTLQSDNPETIDNPTEEIHFIADTLEPGHKSAKTLRAIGIAVYQAQYNTPNSIHLGHFHEDAVRILKRSVEKMEPNSMDKIDSLRLLADSYGVTSPYELPVACLDEALSIFDALESQTMSADEREKFDSKRMNVRLQKAKRLRYADQWEAALDIYNATIKIAGERMPRPALGAMITLSRILDPTGSKMIDMLHTWSQGQRTEWIEYFYGYQAGADKLRQLARVASLTGESDFLIECFTAAEKKASSSKDSLRTLNYRSVLAHLYQTVGGNPERAKKIRYSMMSLKLQVNTWFEDRMKEALIEEWMRFAGTIFSSFQASSDPQQKLALLQELRTIPRVHTNDDLKDSHVGMLLANMLRVMGPASEYHRYMDDIFATCIAGLEDSVSNNDGPSLRLLAKILSSLDGLERDAQIAYSAQYSMLDRSLYEKEQELNGVTNANGLDESGSKPLLEDSDESKLEPKNSHSDAPKNIAKDRTPDETELLNLDNQAELTSDSNSPELAASAEDDAPATTNKTLEESKEQEKSSIPITNPRPWRYEEDRSGFEPICDSCNHAQSEWSCLMYLCLICPTTDICEYCYPKQVKERRAAATHIEYGHEYVCEENHRYLKGCMKGWKGIKDGVIRIDEEELPVKEWIRDLKEVRWKKAWERYWLTQGGLKDIGDSDSEGEEEGDINKEKDASGRRNPALSARITDVFIN